MEQSSKKIDRVLDDFLQGEARADELKEMADALAARFNEKVEGFRRLARGSVEWDLMLAELRELKRQVIVLRQEESISRFVEDSVRMTLGARELLEGGEEPEERDFEDELDWKNSGFPELDDYE